MTLPKPVALLYAPANAVKPSRVGVVVPARLDVLDDELIDRAMGEAWWRDDHLDRDKTALEIDRHWDWHADTTDHSGQDLPLDRFAVVTDDGAVQGAMLLTATGVRLDGEENRGTTGLLVEWLFTAPRNRAEVLRTADHPIFFGAGSALLRFAVERSRQQGHDGRLRLDASPRAIGWYRNRGLRTVPNGHTIFESVEYVTMELSAAAAASLV